MTTTVAHYRSLAEFRRDHDARRKRLQYEAVLPLGAAEIAIMVSSLGLRGPHPAASWRLLIGTDPLFTSRREQVVALASRHTVPAMYEYREFPDAGGLISYGASLLGTWRQLGIYVAKILNGAKPADLPVQQPTNFELVVNLKIAKALCLTVPLSILARADEVIE